MTGTITERSRAERGSLVDCACHPARSKIFVLRLLHIRRIAPKPAPSAGINCTWYNYFPSSFRHKPSSLPCGHHIPCAITQQHVSTRASIPCQNAIVKHFLKNILRNHRFHRLHRFWGNPQRRKGLPASRRFTRLRRAGKPPAGRKESYRDLLTRT